MSQTISARASSRAQLRLLAAGTDYPAAVARFLLSDRTHLEGHLAAERAAGVRLDHVLQAACAALAADVALIARKLSPEPEASALAFLQNLSTLVREALTLDVRVAAGAQTPEGVEVTDKEPAHADD